MYNIRFLVPVLLSIFFINNTTQSVPDVSITFDLNSRDLLPFIISQNKNLSAQEKNQQIHYFYGYHDGYHRGFNNAATLGTVFASMCAMGGFIIGAKIALYLSANKPECENKKAKQVETLHTFIRDLLYALKDVYEHRKKVENSLVHYYLANNDNLEYFLHEQGINDPKIIVDLNEIMDCIRSLVNVCVNFEYTLLHMRTMSEQKYKLLELINGLFGRLNKELKAPNQSEVNLDNDLVTFLLT